MTKPGLLVLAGGGHSHALVLKRWAMQPHRRPQRSIVLVNRHSTALYSGMVPGFIAGLYKRDELAINLRAISERAGVAFIEAEIIGIDSVKKLLHLRGRPSLRYGLLSLDVGAVSPISAEGIPIKPLEPALDFLSEQQPEEKQPFRVIGAGASGVEVVLALRKRWPRRELQLQLREGQLPATLEQVMNKWQIELITSTTPWSGPSLLCSGSRGPNWLKKSSLPINHEGRVITDKHLRVEGIEDIFASGDCAVINGEERPASGVWAVRAAKPLAHNIEAICQGKKLKQWRPQKKALQLIGDYQGKAWSQWWKWRSPTTSILWTLKQKIDLDFMAGFQSSVMTNTMQMACRGCAAKVPAEPLIEALKRVNIEGAAEDAAVLVKGKPVWLQSVDGFPALISDPWLNGRLTALHACSDLWASGATVTSAMATLTLPMITQEEQQEYLVQTLAGIKSALDEQGAELLGGHTMESRSTPPTPTSLGISTTLTVNGKAEHHWRKSGIQPGDSLLLSRPLGTGVLFAGAMIGESSPGDIDAALRRMNESQHALTKDLYGLGSAIHACTDITGFGLLGHLGEMLNKHQELRIHLDAGTLPIYQGVITLLKKGVASTIAPANRKAWQLLDGDVQITNTCTREILELLVDPQTCGPLLVACNAEAAKKLQSTEKWTHIGNAIPKQIQAKGNTQANYDKNTK